MCWAGGRERILVRFESTIRRPRARQRRFSALGTVPRYATAGSTELDMIGPLLKPDVQQLIRDKHWDILREVLSGFDPSDIAEILIAAPDEDDVAIFRLLP